MDALSFFKSGLFRGFLCKLRPSGPAEQQYFAAPCSTIEELPQRACNAKRFCCSFFQAPLWRGDSVLRPLCYL